MAFLMCDFHSAVLGKGCSMNVILPQSPAGKNSKYPVVYLLHGLIGDHTSWSRRSSIERYAEEYNTAIIMADGGRNFYSDARSGGSRYWSFFSEELPETAASLFPISSERSECFAAGLSMGGYGALKLGLRNPERFAAVAGLSSVADVKYRFLSEKSPNYLPELEIVFGKEKDFSDAENDLFTLAENALASGKALPKILSICGSEDFMIDDNRRFNTFMAELDYPGFHSYERPGVHCWEFWDRHIQDVLRFFFKNQLPE